MSKNRKPKPRVRVSAPDPLPWNQTPEGVLRRALEEHDKQPYTELVIVALRGGEPEIFHWSRDALRVVGLLTWTLNTLVNRMRR